MSGISELKSKWSSYRARLLQRKTLPLKINSQRSAAYVTSQVHTSVSAATHVCLFHWPHTLILDSFILDRSWAHPPSRSEMLENNSSRCTWCSWHGLLGYVVKKKKKVASFSSACRDKWSSVAARRLILKNDWNPCVAPVSGSICFCVDLCVFHQK